MLRFGPLGESAVHLCVDMQRLFAEPGEWQAPWMDRVTPQVMQLAEPRPERTIFTRFIPADEPGAGNGTWRRYYERWANMTRSGAESCAAFECLAHVGHRRVPRAPEPKAIWACCRAMRTCWYIVIQSRGRWWVDCEGKAYGPMASKEEASIEAVKIAEVFGDPARRSCVWAPNENGKLVLAWSGNIPART